MKKVFLHAYCFNNVGDDMFVITMAERFPHVNFHIAVKDQYRKVFEKYKNLTLMSSFDEHGIKGRLKLRFSYSAFVKLGGSIFMEPVNWVKQPPFPKWQCLLLNKNKFIMGANFGPCYTTEFFERAKGSLKYYNGICFRDKYSYNMFSQLKNCKYAPDILFGYKHYPEYKTGDGVGISVIKMDGRETLDKYAKEYYASIANACDILIDKNIPVKLFSFCEKEGDEEAINKIIPQMKPETSKKVSVYNYKGNIEEFLREFNSCEYIVGTRFHAMVLGLSMKKKVYPVIYSKKLSNVLEDISFNGKYWNILEGESKDGEQIVTELLSAPVSNISEEFVLSSETHFDAFAKYIK